MKDQIIRIKTITVLLPAALILLASFMYAPAFAGANIPVTIDIPVTYIVNGNDKTAGGDTVTLTAEDPRSPMPGGTKAGKKTITIRKEGSYSFGEIRYEEPGVHWYTIRRSVTKKKGVTKDAPVYRAKVIALNDGHGYVLVYKEGSDEKSELIYTDRTAPDTGDVSGLMLYLSMAAAAAVLIVLFAAYRINNRKKEVRNGSE